MSSDHYATLGLSPSADDAAIRKAFRTLSRQHHPDVGGDAETYRAVTVAYTVLSDPAKRRAYDAGRHDTASGTSTATPSPRRRPTPQASAPSASSAAQGVKKPVRLTGSAPGIDPAGLVRGEVPKRGLFDRTRPGRDQVVRALAAAVAKDVPAAKAFLGVRLSATGEHDAILVAGHRLVVIDVVLSRDVPHGWDGTYLRAAGKRIPVPELTRAVAELERRVRGSRAESLVVVAAAPNETHRPVVDGYGTTGAPTPVNPAHARRQVVSFLGGGADADAVDLGVLEDLTRLR